MTPSLSAYTHLKLICVHCLNSCVVIKSSSPRNYGAARSQKRPRRDNNYAWHCVTPGSIVFDLHQWRAGPIAAPIIQLSPLSEYMNACVRSQKMSSCNLPNDTSRLAARRESAALHVDSARTL